MSDPSRVRVSGPLEPYVPGFAVELAWLGFADLFAGVGVKVERLDLPDTAPVVVGEIPAPPGAPTVLLYSHYDVVPATEEAEWPSQ
jgi:acetylornithine deacetylase/succinyl-diaminopimelate desuccinylase-like protein